MIPRKADTNLSALAERVWNSLLRVYLRTQTVVTPLLIFSVLAGAQALVFIHNVGPLTVPDIDMHLGATYALATGQSFTEPTLTEISDGRDISGEQLLTGDSRFLLLPAARSDLIDSIINNPLSVDPSLAAQVTALTEQSGEQITASFRSNQYIFFSYIPQALGLKLGFVLDLSPLGGLTLARVMNFLVYAALFIIAIVIIPTGKTLIAVIGATPMSVFCASSLMADASVIGFITFFTALCMWLGQTHRRIGPILLVSLVFGGFFLCMLKYTYCPLILLPLVLAWSSFQRNRDRAIYLGGVLVLFLVVAMWWQSQYAYTPGGIHRYEANLAFLRAHFFSSAFTVLSNSLLSVWTILGDSPGVTRLSAAVIALIWVAMLTSARQTRLQVMSEKPAYGRLWLSALLAFASIGLIYASLYLTWNDAADLRLGEFVEGFQLRYVIPLLPLLVVPLLSISGESGRHREQDTCRHPVV